MTALDKIERLEFLLDNCIGYIEELKERETKEERIDFFKSVIGLDDEEIKRYSLDVE